MMRTRMQRLAVLLGAGVLLVGAAGCGSDDSDTSGASATDEEFVVGFSNPSESNEVGKAGRQATEAAGEQAGIQVNTIDAQGNLQKQVSDINQFVAQGVDGIIVYPISTDTLAPALDRARDAGIKVLGIGALTEKPAPDDSVAPYDANLDQGNTFTGTRLLSEYLSEQLQGEKANVLGVGLGLPVPSVQLIMQQYQANMEELAPNATWLGTVENPTDDAKGAQTVVSQGLTKYQNDVQAVMSYNDYSAIGAALAFRNAGIDDAIIVGQNATPQGAQAVEDGQVQAMIDVVPWRMGLAAIAMMQDMLNGESVPNWVSDEVEMYTQENISERLDWEKAISEIEDGTLTCENGGCPESVQ